MPFEDTTDDIWIDSDNLHYDQFGSVHTTSPGPSNLSLQVECKVCGVKLPYIVSRIGIDFFLEPTDLIGICTCYICYHKPKDPPKDRISKYHTRRKLRTRRRR